MPSGKRKLKRDTTIKMARIWNNDNTVLVRVLSHRNSNLLLVEMQNSTGIASLEDSLVFYYKTKHILSIQSSNCAP